MGALVEVIILTVLVVTIGFTSFCQLYSQALPQPTRTTSNHNAL
jgi:hypothetical protein